jgi:hypothetical protein
VVGVAAAGGVRIEGDDWGGVPVVGLVAMVDFFMVGTWEP